SLRLARRAGEGADARRAASRDDSAEDRAGLPGVYRDTVSAAEGSIPMGSARLVAIMPSLIGAPDDEGYVPGLSDVHDERVRWCGMASRLNIGCEAVLRTGAAFLLAAIAFASASGATELRAMSAADIRALQQ